MTTELLIIDPQVDFCDPERGALYVHGAEQDMTRLANLIARRGNEFDRIHVTLDSHNTLHIAHPVYWVDPAGINPEPFTIITAEDVQQNRWRAADPAKRQHGLDYVRALDTSGRYKLCIWPYHCLIGTSGHAVFPALAEQLAVWERETLRAVDYIFKGSNPETEHYSAVKAELPLADDPNTQPNRKLLDLTQRADSIIVAGEAGSHCVAATVRDLDGESEIGLKHAAAKITLLTDATQPVSGFEALQDRFIADMTAAGMRTATTGSI